MVAQEIERLKLVREIETGDRLVEQQQRRLLSERPGQVHALPLAAGELRHRPITERHGVGRLQRPLDRLRVGGALRLKALEVRQPAERHRLAHGERQIDRRVLRQERRAAGDLPA